MHITSPNMFYMKIHDKNKWKEELPWSMPNISIHAFSNQGNVYTNKWMSLYMSLLIIDLEGTPLSILFIFFHQQISIALQMMKVSSILNWEIARSLATYKLSLFPTHFPFPPSTFCKQLVVGLGSPLLVPNLWQLAHNNSIWIQKSKCSPFLYPLSF